MDHERPEDGTRTADAGRNHLFHAKQHSARGPRARRGEWSIVPRKGAGVDRECPHALPCSDGRVLSSSPRLALPSGAAPPTTKAPATAGRSTPRPVRRAPDRRLACRTRTVEALSRVDSGSGRIAFVPVRSSAWRWHTGRHTSTSSTSTQSSPSGRVPSTRSPAALARGRFSLQTRSDWWPSKLGRTRNLRLVRSKTAFSVCGAAPPGHGHASESAAPGSRAGSQSRSFVPLCEAAPGRRSPPEYLSPYEWIRLIRSWCVIV